jgi:hypothetical protein
VAAAAAVAGAGVRRSGSLSEPRAEGWALCVAVGGDGVAEGVAEPPAAERTGAAGEAVAPAGPGWGTGGDGEPAGVAVGETAALATGLAGLAGPTFAATGAERSPLAGARTGGEGASLPGFAAAPATIAPAAVAAVAAATAGCSPPTAAAGAPVATDGAAGTVGCGAVPGSAGCGGAAALETAVVPAAGVPRALIGTERGTGRTAGTAAGGCARRAAASELTRCSCSAARSGARPAHSRRRFISRACENTISERIAIPTSAANAAIVPTLVRELEIESASSEGIMNPESV